MPDRANMTEGQKRAHQELLERLAMERASGAGGGPADSVTPREAVKTKCFWFLWITWCFMGAAGISMVPLSKSYGSFLLIDGVMVLTCFNAANGLSRIVAGSLSDVIGRNIVGALSFLLAAAGYACLPFASGLVPVSILAAFVGFAFGTLFAITAPIGTDLFGLKYFGVIFGLIFTAYGFVGGIVGPLLSSYVLQVTDSYEAVFNYLAVFCLLAAVSIMLAREKNNAGRAHGAGIGAS
jgi:OFA family oxalate/formate antiporter-like MFS transporter